MRVDPAPRTDRSGPTAAREVLRTARVLVPGCTGVALCRVEDRVLQTIATSGEHVARLEGVQYVHHGPCLDATEQGRSVEAPGNDPDDFTAFVGVVEALGARSTLAVPVHDGGQVLGTVNLYAWTREAFARHRDQLVSSLASCSLTWTGPGGAREGIGEAGTRTSAPTGLQTVEDLAQLEIAVRLVGDALDVDERLLRRRIRRAAARAGLTLGGLARCLIAAYDPPGGAST